MQNRSIHLTIYSFLIGLLLLSIGTNILFYNRILILQDFLLGTNNWMTTEQFDLVAEEISRLEKEQYQIIEPNTYSN